MDVESKEEMGTHMRGKAMSGAKDTMMQSDLCEMEESYRLLCTDGMVSKN